MIAAIVVIVLVMVPAMLGPFIHAGKGEGDGQ